MIKGMPRTEYVKCTNPRCGKLNPVPFDEVNQGKEYTCVFCGQLFTSPTRAVQQVEDASFKKRSRGKKLLNPSATRPENRNKSKPNI
ncbi:MAG TPA: hypothetical protein VGB32_06765 [Candidatus Bathyarchaeia archaeon]